MDSNIIKFREEKKKGDMSKSKEDVEECFLRCSMETKQSFTAALQIIYDEVFEINPYEDYIYILNSQYNEKICGLTMCYSSFFWEYVDARVYPHDCDDFISCFEPKALRRFIESGEEKLEKKFIRLRTISKNKAWYIVTLIRNPADSRRLILLMKNEDEACVNEMQKKAIMEDYDYVIGINVSSRKISVYNYSYNMKRVHKPIFFNIFYDDFLRYRIKKYVKPESVDKTYKNMDLKNILIQLEKKEAYTCYSSLIICGRLYHKKYRFVYLDDKKETILMSQMDVTDQIEKEEKKNDMIKFAYQEAKRASESKSCFLSRMSHDMRTPLNAIIGMDMIAASHISEKKVVMDSLNSILYSSKNLLELVNDVLDINNFEHGALVFKESAFSWESELDKIIHVIKPLAVKKKHTLNTDFSGINCDVVIGDAKRITQMCLNLLSNAVKYTEDGGNIFFSITERGAHKEKEEADTVYMEYEMVVEDNGMGISEEFIPHLFEPFERDKKVHSGTIQGTGLGMPIARNLARLMGGEVYVKSVENEGTRFDVTFRLKLPDTNEDINPDENEISDGIVKF